MGVIAINNIKYLALWIKSSYLYVSFSENSIFILSYRGAAGTCPTSGSNGGPLVDDLHDSDYLSVVIANGQTNQCSGAVSCDVISLTVEPWVLKIKNKDILSKSYDESKKTFPTLNSLRKSTVMVR